MATNIPLYTPLQEQIDEFIAEGASWLPPDLLRDLLHPIEQLVTAGAAGNALKEGEQAPDFTLPDAYGNAIRLSHLLQHGPVVISFYRGAWCPFCHLALRAYQRALPQLQELGARLVALSPQTPGHSKALAEKLTLSFALLSDVGNQMAREYGLVFTIEKVLRRAYLRLGANLPSFNGTDTWDIPMAGTFLIDQSGTIRLAFVDPDFTRRLDPSIIITRLNELKG